MEPHRTERDNAESEWIAKYRAALNETAIPQSWLARIRAALKSALHMIISHSGETANNGPMFFRESRGELQPEETGHPQLLSPQAKSSSKKPNIKPDQVRRAG